MLKPLKTEVEYAAATRRLKSLQGARADTDEDDERQVLAALVHQFDRSRFAEVSASPLAAIRLTMEQKGLSVRDLVPFLGSASRVSEVLNGHRPLSLEMIRSLNRHLGIPAEVLIQVEELAARPPKLSHAAAEELRACKVLRPTEGYGEFIKRAWPTAAAIAVSSADRTNAKTDTTAVRAWCAAAMLLARAAPMPIRHRATSGQIEKTLASLTNSDTGPREAVDALAHHGIALITLPELTGTYLDGAAMLSEGGLLVVALTLRHDRIDAFWTTLLHLVVHATRHLSPGRRVILDDLAVSSSLPMELEAEEEARESLIPSSLWSTFHGAESATPNAVVDFAARAGVHPAIVAGRWQHQFRDYRRFSKLLGHGEVRRQFPMWSGLDSTPSRSGYIDMT